MSVCSSCMAPEYEAKNLYIHTDFLDVSGRSTIPDRYEWNMKCLDCLDSLHFPTPPPQFSHWAASDGWVNAADLHGTKFKKKVNVGMEMPFSGVMYGAFS